MTTQTIDHDQAEAFTGKVLGDTAGCMTTVLAAIGDRLGLYRDLAAAGPSTASELAARTAIDARYAQEWLAAMHAAGYLSYSPEEGRFALPAEHRPALVDEPGPEFFGGIHQDLFGLLHRLDGIVDAFRHGGGVHQHEFPDDTYVGMDRFTAMWHENLLLQEWIPAVPGLEAKLRAGARLADVGCGQGRALIKLAGAFPASTFHGFDVFGPNVERSRENARSAGLDSVLRFEQVDVARGLPGTYDVITTWDVIHDSADPVGMLRSIRNALAPGGVYVCLDINCSDRTEENVGPIAALLYGFSILYCMTVSLADGGRGLGTLGLPLAVLRGLAGEAGFGSVEQVPMDNPFNSLYVLRA
jgi:2-polyprenyl-3-methyl-5-hydroxy-6-metoxy-1,4-benzoquinol methylase